MAAKSFEVSAPLVIARGDDGKDVYLYKGSPVPASVKGDELKRLQDGGFLTEAGVEDAPSK